jgi:hypothetical protein
VTLLRSSLRILGGGLLELFMAVAADSIASGGIAAPRPLDARLGRIHGSGFSG